MRLIDRYLLRQLLGPTVLATVALTAVALLSQSLSALDLIVNQRQSALVFAQITLLAMPQLINMVLPIALFVASLVALNRLHTEQEIVVCFAGGMSRWRVISPAVRLASTLAVLALMMNLFIQPVAFRDLRKTMFAVRTDLAATMIREGEFREPSPDLTVYAQSIDNHGVIHNLFIHKMKADGSATTYTAAEGRLEQRNGRPVLVMNNGSNQEFSKAGVLNFLTFDEYIYDLTPLTNTAELVHYKASDRFLHELVFPDMQQDWERRNRLKMLAEANDRIASPLYNIAFVALALWAIVGGGFNRLGYGRRIAAAAATAAGVRILGFIFQAASESEVWLNVAQYAIPILTTVFGLRGVFHQHASRRRNATRRRPVQALTADA
jgi:lipopolysaccharide export system permease protein